MPWSSRIPGMTAGAAARVAAANRVSAERIAADARRDAPDRPPIGKGMVDSIKAVPTNEGHEVHVDFPGHLLEFGTVKMSPRPFLVPAAEAERADHVLAVRKALDL
jgi:hypothetical protein